MLIQVLLETSSALNLRFYYFSNICMLYTYVMHMSMLYTYVIQKYMISVIHICV